MVSSPGLRPPEILKLEVLPPYQKTSESGSRSQQGPQFACASHFLFNEFFS